MTSLDARLGLVLVAATVACSSPSAPAAPTSAPGAPHLSLWSYSGATGPAHWGDLDDSFALCGRGAMQSPIDLPLLRESARPFALPHWDPVPLTSILNTGHTVQVDDPAPSSLVLDGVTYSLLQFHFHVPADHTIEGRTFDAELHLVHRSPDGQLLAVALFFDKGAENAVLRPLFDAIPAEAGGRRSVPEATIDLGALLPRAPRFLSYQGSLTAPPCTEGVRWLIAVPDPAPLEIAEADLIKLRAAVHAPTSRPQQPRNGRAVELRAP